MQILRLKAPKGFRRRLKARKPAPKMTLPVLMGWVGTILVLLAFGLLSFGLIDQGRAFQAMNLIGGLGLCVSAVEKRNRPAVALEGIWAVISTIALIRPPRS